MLQNRPDASDTGKSGKLTVTELWLLRHGQTDWNLTGRWQGQADDAPGLNQTGRAQVLGIRDRLMDIRFTAVYSSDLLRAKQTADLVAQPLGLTVALEPRLREMDLGRWEGVPSEEIKANYARELAVRVRNPLHARAPEGESAHDVTQRVLAAVNDIAGRHGEGPVLIVSHGICLAVIICLASGNPRMEDVYQQVPDNAQPLRVGWKSWRP